tara:strand:+ start:189 stop:509 length:321 start_codon:yes stop_codon:yes gene_type:complete
MSSADKQQNNSKKVPGKPFKPGQSGNLNGRPKKGLAIADILNAKSSEADESGETMKEKMLRKVYALATGPRPERWAVEFIADRTEGKALERIDQTTRLEPFKLIER